MSKEKLRLDPKTGEFISVMTAEGQEIPDPTPVAPPVGFKRQQPLHERIRAMVQHEFMRSKQMEDYESPEEADDFLVPDESGTDPREASFALMPGHEHDWEENYDPPKDFKDMKQRLIDAGWSPPKQGQEVSAEKPAPKDDASAKPLDAAQAPKIVKPASKPA